MHVLCLYMCMCKCGVVVSVKLCARVHACLRAQVTFCARVSDAHINSCLSNAHVLAQTTCTHARWLALTRITHARAHAHKLIHIS